MIIYMSQVGLQPSAPAVSAKTLFFNTEYGLDKIILLHTKRTYTQAVRLEQYFRAWNEKTLDIKLVNFPEAGDDPNGVVDSLTEYINTQSLVDQDVYLDVGPGRNVEIALLGEVFRENADSLQSWIPVYADEHYLFSLKDCRRWELENLGMQEILGLYGFQPNPESQEIECGLWRNLKIGSFFSAFCAYEKKGRLYALCRLEDYHNRLDEFVKKYEDSERNDVDTGNKSNLNKAMLQACRNLLRFHTNHGLLCYLRPKLSLWTNSRSQAMRFRTYGLYSFLKKNDQYQEIESVVAEWRRLGSSTCKASTTTQEMLKGYHYSPGENGIHEERDVLLVVLGRDPSASLIALYTCRPGEVFFYYDQATPEICVIAQRLLNIAKSLPAGYVHFVPTDILGRNTEKACNKIKTQNPNIIFVINPGTKAQTWSLSTMELDLNIWSLDNQKAHLIPLDPEMGYKAKRYRLPSVNVQASVCGGELKNPGKSWENILSEQKNSDFLYYSMQVISNALNNQQKHNQIVDQLFKLSEGVIIGRSKWLKVNSVVVQDGTECLRITTKFNDFHSTGILISPLVNDKKSMIWFEHLIAGYLVKIFQNRKNFDLQWGVEWPQLQKRELTRTEIDIIMSFDHYFLGISCKLGVKKTKPEIDSVRAEIITEAKENIGRFAIPVLVRGDIQPSQAKKIAQESLESEPLEIGACLLKNTEYLHSIINQYISIRKET